MRWQHTLQCMTTYPNDLTDTEWLCVNSLMPTPKTGGRARIHSLRAILDMIFQVLRSGCPWRLLTRGFPPWKAVYHIFHQRRIDGTSEQLNSAPCERLRIQLGRNSHSGAAIVDSQSGKTTGLGGKYRGCGGGKKVRGRKRHLSVDTQELALKVKVDSAAASLEAYLFSAAASDGSSARSVSSALSSPSDSQRYRLASACFAEYKT